MFSIHKLLKVIFTLLATVPSVNTETDNTDIVKIYILLCMGGSKGFRILYIPYGTN